MKTVAALIVATCLAACVEPRGVAQARRQHELEMAKLGYVQEVRSLCTSDWGNVSYKSCKDSLVWVKTK